MNFTTIVNTDYFIPSVDYPSQMIKFLAQAKEFDIITKYHYDTHISPLIQRTFASNMNWEICAEFWRNIFHFDLPIYSALRYALHEWDK